VALWIRKVPQAAELWDLIQMQGKLFGLMAVGKKESKPMHHKIGGAAVAGVLHLGNVWVWCHIGAKLIQKSSTAQNNSSKLIARYLLGWIEDVFRFSYLNHFGGICLSRIQVNLSQIQTHFSLISGVNVILPLKAEKA
jgi:hypothetical protein